MHGVHSVGRAKAWAPATVLASVAVFGSTNVSALLARAAILVGLVGCSRPAASASAPPAPAESLASASDAAPAADVLVALASPNDSEAKDAALEASSGNRDAPRLNPSQAASVLFLADDTRPTCATGDDEARVECLLASRFVDDPRAAKVALDLYERTNDLAGLSPAETMEGGWRGTLHLVPALPVGKERTHLEWIADATRDYDAFFDALASGEPKAPRYVWRGLAFRFMRSVGARTPSAYALRSEGANGAAVWTVAYNLDGSLNKSADMVRELVFHENFHLNDEDHGDWSVHTLGATFDSIVARCGTKISCLTPFTPTEMTVRGGTYYAFQPNNGAAVREYAAENASSWKLIVDEFFGGIDRTPACE
jgi:hypothetical protein